MTARAETRLLSWPGLVAAQFSLTVKSRRWMELIAGAIALQAIAFSVVMVVDRVNSQQWSPWSGTRRAEEMQQLDLGAWTIGLVILAATWPTFLWRNETPSERRYHWSLPAARGSHDLARVAAGAIWLVILTVLMVVFVAICLPRVPLYMVGNPQFLMTLFIAYGLASIAALTTERPLVWVLGTIALAPAVIGALEMADLLNDLEWLYEDDSALFVWSSVAIIGLAFVTRRRTGAPTLTLRRA